MAVLHLLQSAHSFGDEVFVPSALQVQVAGLQKLQLADARLQYDVVELVHGEHVWVR